MNFHPFVKLFLCAALLAPAAFAQETVESVRRQIKAVEAETAREKSLHDSKKRLGYACKLESWQVIVVQLNQRDLHFYLQPSLLKEESDL